MFPSLETSLSRNIPPTGLPRQSRPPCSNIPPADQPRSTVQRSVSAVPSLLHILAHVKSNARRAPWPWTPPSIRRTALLSPQVPVAIAFPGRSRPWDLKPRACPRRIEKRISDLNGSDPADRRRRQERRRRQHDTKPTGRGNPASKAGAGQGCLRHGTRSATRTCSGAASWAWRPRWSIRWRRACRPSAKGVLT